MSVMILMLLALAHAPSQVPERREVHPPEAPGESTYSVEVEFVIETGPQRARVPVAGEIVEFGLGSKLDHAPLYADMPVLARVTSDEQGRLRATLEVPERYRGDGDARIWARIETPGRKRLLKVRPLRSTPGDPPTRMYTYRGGTITGTVLDGLGLPVVDADLGLLLKRDGVFERVIAGAATSDRLGRFAINYHYAGTYHLQARVVGLGSAVTRSLELPLGAAPQDEQLTILPGVSLAGRVIDPAGHPVPGLEVTAVPRAGFPTAAQRIEREAAGGLLLGITRTDRAGRFEFRNLVAGEYTLHGTYSPRNASPLRIKEERLGPRLGALSAPSDELGAVVSSAYRLEVTVTDHAGLAVHLLGASSAETTAPDGEGLIRATAIGEWAPELRPIEFDDLLVFPADPDREYLVSRQEPGRPYFETRAYVPPGLHRVPVRIRLSPPGAAAQLEVQVRVPPAGAVPGEGYWNLLEVVVRSQGGRMLAGTVVRGATEQASSAEPSWTTFLPPGRYTVEVGTAVIMDCTSPFPYPRDPYLRAAREVELTAGEERAIEVRVGAAGHLDFEPLEARRAMTDTEYRDLTPESLISEEVIEAARRRLNGVRVVLVSDSGARRFELERFEVPGPGSLSMDGIGWIVRGWTARGLSAVPVGDWTLRLMRGAEVVLERPVTITQGAVTTVRW